MRCIQNIFAIVLISATPLGAKAESSDFGPPPVIDGISLDNWFLLILGMVIAGSFAALFSHRRTPGKNKLRRSIVSASIAGFVLYGFMKMATT